MTSKPSRKRHAASPPGYCAHLLPTRSRPLPAAFLSLDAIPSSVLPFDAYYQDRVLKRSIELVWQDYWRINGDTEMETQDGATTTVQLSIVPCANDPQKPTRFDVHVTSFHGEDKGDKSQFTASSVFSFPVALARNESFVQFNTAPYKYANQIAGQHHTWCELPAAGVASDVQVRFDHKGHDDTQSQGMKATLHISYKVFIVARNPKKVAALRRRGAN